jgi:hypothetical protein
LTLLGVLGVFGVFQYRYGDPWRIWIDAQVDRLALERVVGSWGAGLLLEELGHDLALELLLQTA